MLVEFGSKDATGYTDVEELHKEADRLVRKLYRAINPEQLTDEELVNVHRFYILIGMYTTKLHQYAQANAEQAKIPEYVEISTSKIKELIDEDRRKKK